MTRESPPVSVPEQGSPERFRCTACGACCRSMRVVLTHRDLLRLSGAVADLEQRLAWLGPDEVDMTDEPGSFVELSLGRRIMTLAWKDGGCGFLGADGQCGVYAERPLDCRAYPLDFSEKHARLLPLLDNCEMAWDATTDLSLAETEDGVRWTELAEYQALVAAWNQSARRRRRMGLAKGSAAEFVAFLLRRTPPELKVLDGGLSEASDAILR